MSNGPSPSPPTGDSVLASLAAAADAARQAYLTALAANPGADLSQMYAQEMAAASIWSAAAVKAFNNDPAVAEVQANLDSTTKVIKSELTTIKNIDTWVTLLGSLVQAATRVATFFA